MNKEKGEYERKNGINKRKRKEHGGSEKLKKKKNNSTKNQSIWCCYLTAEHILLNKIRTISQQTALGRAILEKLINYLFRNFHPFIKFGVFFFAVLGQPTLLSYPEPVEITQQYHFSFFSSRRSAFTPVLWNSHNCD